MKVPLITVICACVFSVPTFANVADLRLRLGVTDKEATGWSGTVSVSHGKVLISGWRKRVFVDLALLKGGKLACESSSDHGSARHIHIEDSGKEDGTSYDCVRGERRTVNPSGHGQCASPASYQNDPRG